VFTGALPTGTTATAAYHYQLMQLAMAISCYSYVSHFTAAANQARYLHVGLNTRSCDENHNRVQIMQRLLTHGASSRD